MNGGRYADNEHARIVKLHSPRLLLTIVGFLTGACKGGVDNNVCAGRLPSAQQADVAAALDSTAAVSLLRCAILAVVPDEDTATLDVAAFVADSAGFDITLVPAKSLNVAGGGGRARITRSGLVRNLELFQ